MPNSAHTQYLSVLNLANGARYISINGDKRTSAKVLNTGTKWVKDKTGNNASERLNQSHNAEIVMMLGPSTKIIFINIQVDTM